jgi:hypothetical protein
MIYKKEVNDIEKALSLDKAQVTRLKNAIGKAYDQNWHKDGPNIDQINAAVAPYIKSQEEAFFAAFTIFNDTMDAMAMAMFNKMTNTN